MDRGEGPPVPPPRVQPYWSFPAAQEVMSHRRKRTVGMGISPSVAIVLLLLFLLVFAAMGIGAYQIYKLQDNLRTAQQTIYTMQSSPSNILTHEKQVGFQKPELDKVKEDVRPAAHVIGRIHSGKPQQALRWEPKAGRAFTEGGVVYRAEDGALVVNRTGLYHVYSRVELMLRQCSPAPYRHSVFVRRLGSELPLTLMEGRGKDVCGDWTRGRMWTSDSYLAAALPLQREDRVFVNMSHPMDMSHNHHANFFGLYKI